MLSPEERNKKPYALPVQCLPCGTLKDDELQSIVDKLIEEMVKRGMKVAGKSYCIL